MERLSPIVWLSNLVIISFGMQKPYMIKPICQLLLFHEQWESYSDNHCLCLDPQVSSCSNL
jgi:hypothetical protein